MFQYLIYCQDDPDTLEFHHIGEEYTGMPKKRSISSMVSRQLPLFEIEVEMSKCAVLCASCHQKVHHEGKEASFRKCCLRCSSSIRIGNIRYFEARFI